MLRFRSLVSHKNSLIIDVFLVLSVAGWSIFNFLYFIFNLFFALLHLGEIQGAIKLLYYGQSKSS